MICMMAVAEHYDSIPHDSHVVFDWDNTLKIINRATKTISCSVSHSFLHNLVTEKGCQLYIISAIRPSRINMETLLMEVDKLGIREFFCPSWQADQVKGHKDIGTPTSSTGHEQCSHDIKIQEVKGDFSNYVRWGNIVICGYEKAEVFLELTSIKDDQEDHRCDTSEELVLECEVEDDEAEYHDATDANYESFPSKTEPLHRPVVFFDDEEVNIINFKSLVHNSTCIWIH